MKTVLKVLLWIVIVVVVIFLVLFVSAKVSGLDTIPNLINYLIGEFNGTNPASSAAFFALQL